jgi:outer membrane protein assembly factor BamB
MHAFAAAGPSGQNQVWSQQGAQSFGPPTVAGGMTFSGYAFGPQVQVRNASTGALLTSLNVASDCFCGITVTGNAVFFGTGSPQQGAGDGVYAFTPLAVAPTVLAG